MQVIRYFIDEHDMEWQLANPNTILQNNITTFDFDLDTEQIEEDMKTAFAKRDKLINDKYIIRKNYVRLLKWLALGSVRGIIKFKVDQTIPVCKKYMDIINLYAKQYKKEDI